MNDLYSEQDVLKYAYLVKAECHPYPIIISFLGDLVVPRDIALFVLVLTDLLGIFILYFSILCVRSF